MAAPLQVYHNARCSKSRSACAILTGRGLAAETIDYLRLPPSRDQLIALAAMLGVQPLALIRQGEPVFKEHYAGRSLSADQALDALVAHPILLERPIVVQGGRAIIARPPELLEAWLDNSQEPEPPR